MTVEAVINILCIYSMVCQAIVVACLIKLVRSHGKQ